MSDRIPEACDLLIEAGFVVPVVPHGVVLEHHAVAVTGGRIVAILPVVILFMLIEKRLVGGLTAGSVK